MENKISEISVQDKINVTNDSSAFGSDGGIFYVALSPDGASAAVFNSESCVIKIYDTENLTSTPTIISCDEIRSLDSPTVKISYSLAISNPIRLGETDADDTLIAVSCFNDKDMMKEIVDDSTTDLRRQSHLDMAEKGDDFKTEIKSSTFVISKHLKIRIKTSIDEYGGVVKFLDDDRPEVNLNNIKKLSQSNGDDHKLTNLVVMNSSGIIKSLIYHDSYSKQSYFNTLPKVNEYEFPTIIQAKIDNLFQDVPCTRFLQNSVVSNYLFTEGYKNQKIEMYNLNSLNLDMTFQKRDETLLPISNLTLANNPIFSVSNFGHLLAHCSSAKTITIYLMENGLEILTKEFKDSNRILSVSFINNDEKLFIVTEEEDENGLDINGKINFIPVIYIWDLFTFKNDLRNFNQNTNFLNSLQNVNHHSIAISNGIILTNLQNGNLFSVLDLPDIKNLLKPSNNELRKLLSVNIKQEQQNNSLESHSEPWANHKEYKYISIYLNESKTIQLIIGETTVQVWRGKNVADGSNTKKVLEYIWTNPDNKKIDITSLEIGNCEFSLDLLLPSAITSNLTKTNIHWPNEAHVLKDACGAIEYLYERRHKPVGPKNQNKYDILVKSTERLIKKCIKQNPNVWKLTGIRYEIMTNLIQSKNTLLLHQILFDYKKVYINDNVETRVSRYLHIPRQYSWAVREKKSDLETAIERSSDKDRKGKAIVAMLLEYYSNNAEKNTGWMFTVTRAMHLLNQGHLESYLKELLYKPCFGAKEELVDSKFIIQKKLVKGYKKDIYTLDIKPRLIKKQNERRWWSNVKNIKKTIKYRSTEIEDEEDEENTHVALRVVPLPDFTAYPEHAVQKTNNWMIPLKLLRLFFWPRKYLVQKDDQRSSFLKLIRENKNEILYDNPAMEACINFKWSSARNHFLRHFIIFLLFALLFSLLTGIISIDKFYDNLGLSIFLYLVFFYLGYYLLAIEIVQLKYEGFKRYWSVYNLLDLGSVIISLVVVINSVATIIRWALLAINDPNFDENDPDGTSIYKVLQDNNVDVPEDLKKIIIPEAFAVLLLWLELMLLTRFFSRPAIYINMIINILQAIWPFMLFMVGIILAFGHAMHILLRDPEAIGLDPNGDSYTINSNDPNVDTSNVTVDQKFDVTQPLDNYYVKFHYSIMAVFFWILGRWDQLEVWDFWPIYVISILAGILLVIIMQNLLIAIMTGVFEDATANVKLAVLKYRADLIADYETLEKIYATPKGNSRYIYYVGNSEYQEEWLDKADKYRKLHKSLLSEDINNQLLIEKYDNNHNKEDFDDDDDSDFYGDSSKNLTNEIFESNFNFNDDNNDNNNSNNDNNNNNNNNGDILKLKNEIKDVTEKLNSVEENLKEILSFIKKSTT